MKTTMKMTALNTSDAQFGLVSILNSCMQVQQPRPRLGLIHCKRLGKSFQVHKRFGEWGNKTTSFYTTTHAF